MSDLHYDELSAWMNQRRSLRMGQVGAFCATLLGIYLTLGAREPYHKLVFSGAALGAAVTGLSLAKQDERISARLQDVDDISLDAWQDRLFRSFRGETGKLTLEQEPAIARLPLFDWNCLADADEHPVLGIVSPMGGGKTRLCKFLARHVLGVAHINVHDIYARASDWQGSTVLVEHADMLEAMGRELDEIKADVAAYRGDKSDFPGVLTVVEEGADTLLSLKQLDEETSLKWLQKYTTVTRKIRRRLCVVSVKLNGVDFGTGAESRNDATIIFPGAKGVAKAMTDDRILKLGAKQNAELRETLRASLEGIQRPALVFHGGQWYPASIPELNEHGDLPGTPLPAIAPADASMQPAIDLKPLPPIVEIPPVQKPGIRNQLERLFAGQSADEHPIEGTNSEVESDLPEDLQKLAYYIKSKGEVEVYRIKQNWGKNNGFTSDEVGDFLIRLMQLNLIETFTPLGRRGEWVKWAF